MLSHYGLFAEAPHLHIAANTFPSTTIKFGPSFVHLIYIAFAMLAISKAEYLSLFLPKSGKKEEFGSFFQTNYYGRFSMVVANFEAQDAKYILFYLANRLVENMKLRMIPPAFQETAHENIGDFAKQKETEKISKILRDHLTLLMGESLIKRSKFFTLLSTCVYVLL